MIRPGWWLLGCGFLTLVAGCGESKLERMKRAARAGNPDDPQPEQATGPQMPGPPVVATKPAAPAAVPAPPVTPIAPPTPSTPAPPIATQVNSPAASATPVASAAPVAPAASVAPPAPPVTPPTPPVSPLSPAERRARTIKNLTAIAAAFEAYTQNSNAVPEQAFTDETTRAPLLSWRVAILPQLGHGQLYSQFKLDQRWDSPHNQRLLQQIPPEFQSPERLDEKTNYLCPVGDAVAMAKAGNRPFTQFKDGLANTLLLVETDDAHAVPWTQPADFAIDLAAPQAGLGTLREDGFFGILANAILVKIPATTPAEQVRALFTFAAGDGPKAIDIVKDPSWTASTVVAASVNAPAIAAAPFDSPLPPATSPPAVAQPLAPPIDVATITALLLPGGVPRNGLAPIPSPAEATAAKELLREVYARDYAAAQRPEDRQKLALQLIADAATVTQKAEQHEMLRIARDVSVQTGDLAAALQAGDALAKAFAIDPLELRAKTLADIQATGRNSRPDQVQAEARQLLLDALQVNHFAVALAAHDIVSATVRNQPDKRILAAGVAAKEEIEAAQQAYADVPAALSTLAQNASDPAASEIVGKYLCLFRHRWDLGLPLLARSENLKLRFVASIDLEANKSPKTLLQLGDQYWTLGDEFKGAAKAALLARAARCYSTALPQLEGSLERIKVQKRVTELVNTLGQETIDELAGDQIVATPRTGSDPKATGKPDPNAQFE